MFVNERGGHDGSQQSLWFLQAIPRCWLKPGSHLSIEQIGTRFGGRADVSADVKDDGNSIAVTARHDLVVQTGRNHHKAAFGDGRRLNFVRVNGVRQKF